MKKTTIFNRFFKNWKTSIGGLVLGIIQIVVGVQESDPTQIATGAATALGGLYAQD